MCLCSFDNYVFNYSQSNLLILSREVSIFIGIEVSDVCVYILVWLCETDREKHVHYFVSVATL